MKTLSFSNLSRAAGEVQRDPVQVREELGAPRAAEEEGLAAGVHLAGKAVKKSRNYFLENTQCNTSFSRKNVKKRSHSTHAPRL